MKIVCDHQTVDGQEVLVVFDAEIKCPLCAAYASRSLLQERYDRLLDRYVDAPTQDSNLKEKSA